MLCKAVSTAEDLGRHSPDAFSDAYFPAKKFNPEVGEGPTMFSRRVRLVALGFAVGLLGRLLDVEAARRAAIPLEEAAGEELRPRSLCRSRTVHRLRWL
jgi:hypothetical protein